MRRQAAARLYCRRVPDTLREAFRSAVLAPALLDDPLVAHDWSRPSH
jgi:hypothetical protein